jgi:hypothetical protein
MNYGGESVNVYAEAKTEYTRQLSQHLVPALQIYFLDLLKLAKEKDPDSKKILWNFQTLIQEIPDWNQDKVIRETEKIQKDSNCDYLEELLTAVFIAHTKVLSAIRLSTKQKKMQITVPKMDHFLHRCLREVGRLIWGNAFLYAEQGSSIDRQKNMRQADQLIQEGILQAIRSMLPVKTILKEYLAGDDDEDDKEEEEEDEKEEVTKVKEEVKHEEKSKEEKSILDELNTADANIGLPTLEGANAEVPKAEVPKVEDIKLEVPKAEVPKEEVQNHKEVVAENHEPTSEKNPEQTIVVDTEPTVRFANFNTVFDANNPEKTTFEEHNDMEEDEQTQIQILDTEPPAAVDDFEDLEQKNEIEYEELA